MDDPLDDAQDALNEYGRQRLLEWFGLPQTPQPPSRLPKVESDARLQERFNVDEQQIVADPYLLYRSAISLATQIDGFFEQRFKSRGIDLAVQVMEAVAELGTVLISPPTERSIASMACLKRALGRISVALETAKQLEHRKVLSSAQCERLTTLLFGIRDGIVDVMGECRFGR